MKKYATAFLSRLAVLLEFCISIMLAVGIILLSLRLAASLIHIPRLDVYPNYEDLLETCFNLIIGVELIRMMYCHTPDSVFEALIFAVARQIITDHSSTAGSLIGVCSIAALFATKKYLSCNFEPSEKNIFRASAKINAVNRAMNTSVPCAENETVGEVLEKRLKEEKKSLFVGAFADYCGLRLRVEKIKNGKISRIEVIPAIH